MTTEILLAPVGAGKTETVINRLVETLNRQPLAKVWALLASRRQTDAFRQRLVEWETGRRVFFNVEFFDFYTLYPRLLDMAGNPQRPLTDSARLHVLRQVIVGVQPELAVFGQIAQTPGFVRIAANFIDELKQHSVQPETYRTTASTPKDHDLALIYAGYQDYLRANALVDQEGQGWLAVEALVADSRLAGDLALVLVDGFDQFTAVQTDLLAQLAGRAGETLITLTTVPERESTVGRRFQQTLDRLQSHMAADVYRLDDSTAGKDRHPALRHLVDHIFLPDAPPIPGAVAGAVTFIEAPDPAAEVGAVLRQVKRLLLEDNTTRPEDMLIALRDWERYRVYFSLYKRKYALPLALHYGEPLAENPAVQALLNLLTLHESGFHHRPLIDTLQSPYFTLPERLDAARVAQISRLFTVMRGRDDWHAAVRRAGLPGTDEYGRETPPLLPGDQAAALADALDAFFDQVTPPPQATLPQYIAWVEALIGMDDSPNNDENAAPSGLQMPANLRDDAAPESVISRDLAALQVFQRGMAGMLAAWEVAYAGQDTTPIPWETFFTDLRTVTANASVNAHPGRSGQVLVTTAANARGLPHKHVFILGLSEGLFPMQTPEDPLHLDTERETLQAAGLPLETRRVRRADDGLFYEMLCLPRESITFSRPALQDGQPWVESPFWRAALALFDDSAHTHIITRLPVGNVVTLGDAAALDEVAVSLADSLNSPPEQVTDSAWRGVAWMRAEHLALWGQIVTGRRVEASRMSPTPFDTYTGVLCSAELIDQVADTLGPRRRWSASQFNTYGACPFQFFAARLLRLETLDDPEEGMNAAQRGSLIHAILEHTYAHLQHTQTPIFPGALDTTLDALRRAAVEVLTDAPRRQGFRESALWEQEKAIILRTLERLVRADFETGEPIAGKFGTAPRTPYRLEVPFGFNNTPALTIDLGGDVGTVCVGGFIDRIDRQGSAVIVIDYKSGATTIPTTELTAGRNFQMMVYLLAAEAILRQEGDPSMSVKGGGFLHIQNRKMSGVIQGDETGALLDKGKEHLTKHIAAARRGEFTVHPSKYGGGQCMVRYCDFRRLCRVDVTHRHKQ